MTISLLCPTRKRPGEFRRLYDSVVATAGGARWEIVAVVDADDPSYDGMRDLPNVVWVTAPEDCIFSDLWNVAWRNAKGSIFQMAADDMTHNTEGWPGIVQAAMPRDRIAFIWGDDMTGFHSEMGTLGFVSREWCDALGYFAPAFEWDGVRAFESDYCDAWLSDLGHMIGRHIRVPIETEHHHFTVGKSPMDNTYSENRSRYAATNPSRIYTETLQMRLAHAARLAEVMQ